MYRVSCGDRRAVENERSAVLVIRVWREGEARDLPRSDHVD